MNFNGELPSLSGRDIEGNLDVTGNIKAVDAEFKNIVVTDTLTVDKIISDIKINDALVHIGLDNPNDNINLGLFWEYNDGSKKYGGIIRDRLSKKIKVFENQSVLPEPNTDITLFSQGDLECDLIKCNNNDSNITNANQIKIKTPTGFISLDAFLLDSQLNFNIIDNVGGITPLLSLDYLNGSSLNSSLVVNSFLQSENFTLGLSPLNNYSLPSTRGTLDQVLKTNGNGVVLWSEPPNIFDQSLNTSDDVKFNSVDTPDFVSSTTFMEFNALNGDFRFGNNTVSTASLTLYGDNTGIADFSIRNSSGAPAFRIESLGGNTGWMAAGDATSPLLCNTLYWTNTGYRFNRNLDFKRDNVGGDTHIRFDNQNVTNSALIFARSNVNKHRLTSTSDDKLIFRSDVTTNDILTMDDTNITIGQAATAYTLPAERGTIRQILITDANGGVTWQDVPNIFNQDLNTFNEVTFNEVTTNNIKYQSTTGTVTVQTGGLEQHLDFSYNGGAGFFPLLTLDSSISSISSPLNVSDICQFGNSTISLTKPTKISGTLTMGVGGTNYILPNTRGTLNQVLKTDAAGVVSWADESAVMNPFDQSLNTTDKPKFEEINIDAPINAPVLKFSRNNLTKYNMITDLTDRFIINDQVKGIFIIENSQVIINDNAIINGSIKLQPIIEPVRPTDGKTFFYTKFDEDPYFLNGAGAPINYTTDNTGYRMVPPLTYCEASYFNNTLAINFTGIAPEWVTVATNSNLILGKRNNIKYTDYQTVGAQLSVFNPPRNIRYNCTCSFTCKSTSVGGAVPREFAVFVNGVEQRGKHTIQIDDSNNTYPISNTIISIIDVNLNTSNIILLRVRNPDNSTQNVVVSDLSFILTELQ